MWILSYLLGVMLYVQYRDDNNLTVTRKDLFVGLIWPIGTIIGILYILVKGRL